MATWASFTTIDDALTHNLTLALLGLEHARISSKDVAPRYIGLREVPGAQPPDAVLGVCSRGDAACPGHRLPLHSATQALACCIDCDALVGVSSGASADFMRAAGAAPGAPARAGWRCKYVCSRAARPRPDDPSRPLFGDVDNVEAAADDERVREALGLSASKQTRARWIGLRLDTFSDGTRRVVGVCHAHHTEHWCPGHALALRYLADATACCCACGAVVATTEGVDRAAARGGAVALGKADLDAGGRVTGWVCRACAG